MAINPRLVSSSQAAPVGLFYIPEFLDVAHEQHILEKIDELPFGKSMLGVYKAKRTVIHYTAKGYQNDYGETHSLDNLPDWLTPLRERCTEILGYPVQRIEQVLITRYDNAGIGWHRDRPQYGPTVIGISLGTANRMRFRRSSSEGEKQFQIMLEPRSLYVMSAEARSEWQHSMPETKELRYSITFRTILADAGTQKRITKNSLSDSDDISFAVKDTHARLHALGLIDQLQEAVVPLKRKQRALQSVEAVQLRLPL